MANTTNFGWETPDDTDLVKDGAAAMRTLGNAIDASLVDLKGGTTGQVLSKNTNTDMDFVWTTPQTGDITAVTAGTGLSGGGTSGDVTLTNTVATTFDAKGDLVVGTGADTFAKLVAGSNGDTLVADSSATTGLRWQASQAGGKNVVINGGFDIWQRGTSFSFGGFTYTSDRWQAVRGSSVSGGTASRQTTTLDGFQYCARVQRNSGNSATNGFEMATTIESNQIIPLQNKTVTLSFYARKGANYSSASDALSVRLFTGTVADQGAINPGGWTGFATPISATATLTGSWQRFTYSATLGATIQEGQIYFAYTPSGTAGAEDFFEITGVQLELGSVATTFTRSGGTLAGEVAACQRYYEILTRNEWTAISSATSTTATVTPFVFRVTKRVAPTMTVATAGTGSGQVSSLTSAGALPATAGTSSSGAITVDGFQFLISGASASYTAGQGLGLYANGSTTIWTASAEL